MAKRETRRHAIQALGALALNGHLRGFLDGRIYTGASKGFCVPVLNCYSCPGALGACPIGSLQAVAGSPDKSVGLYVVGLITLFGLLLGRWFCGYLCPFGFLQEILYAIPTPKLKIPKRVHNLLRYGKYVMLIIPVLMLPALLTDQWGFGSPTFCQYVCPAGLIEAGWPLIAKNPSLWAVRGHVYMIKLVMAILFILSSLLIMRPFCKYTCPMGAALGCFHCVSFYRMEVGHNCIECGACERTCPMDLVPYKTPNSPECIRCHRCIDVCPTKTLNMIKPGEKKDEKEFTCPKTH